MSPDYPEWAAIGSKGWAAAHSRSLRPGGSWCERGDSNPHGLPRQILSLVRLPIPPLSLVEKKQLNYLPTSPETAGVSFRCQFPVRVVAHHGRYRPCCIVRLEMTVHHGLIDRGVSQVARNNRDRDTVHNPPDAAVCLRQIHVRSTTPALLTACSNQYHASNHTAPSVVVQRGSPAFLFAANWLYFSTAMGVSGM